MTIGQNTLLTNEIYNQLGQKYSQLDTLDKEQTIQRVDKDEFNRIASNENYDEKDYERVIQRFQNTDEQIKTHEQAHASSSNYASTPDYNYQMGPDGKLYATSGEVRIDTSIPEDEKAATSKLDEISNTSSAPNDLSAADAQITRTANLNKMLLQSMQGEENAN